MTCSKPERKVYWAPHSSEQTPGTTSPGWKSAAPSSPLRREVPDIVLYLQGDGGCCKCIPVNPVSFFLQLIIFSILHRNGSQLWKDSRMSRGMCDTRACATMSSRSLEIIVLSCRLLMGCQHLPHHRALLRIALQCLHLLSTQETCISFTLGRSS